ncbi:SGNH/GDSL hydrolase family protein [Nocardioides houyundeii]|uniref:SGNH/GDSL hydrolase family protein n=1 Tax=Nocardioides houyundeii TaxID=2045452 RepID=UPI0013B3B1B8|nr:SGNH/GDSL hydrolase family protein [Nocardioides houyundeii]
MSTPPAAVVLRLRLVGAGILLATTAAVAPGIVAPAHARSTVDRELDSLASGVVRSVGEPVDVAFLGSSTTYGAGATSAGNRFTDLVTARLAARRPGADASRAKVLTLDEATKTPVSRAGLRGVNAGQPGATATTYASDLTVYGLGLLQPACVVHTVGSNDAVGGVPVHEYASAVRAAVRRINRAARGWRDAPCHVLVHTARRHQVSVERWAEYGGALAGVAEAMDRVSFVDASLRFEVFDAAGSDPFDLMGADRTHLTDAGHALLADVVADALGRGLGSDRRLRRLDHDRDGLRDLRELRGLPRPHCLNRPCPPIRTDPLLRDTDGDGASDGREVRTGHDPARASSHP